MTSDVLFDQLVAEVDAIYAADSRQAPARIDALLKERLAHHPAREARAFIRRLSAHFQPTTGGEHGSATDRQVLARVFGLILGRRVTPDDLSSTELLERLAESLNTIFDALNQLISVINQTLAGGTGSGEQTIRQFISFHLEGEDQIQSLEAYLGQIGKAFLTTQEAFKKAAHTKIEQILQALDPNKIAAERSGGLKIGVLRKAEDFDILKEKIERIQRWFVSGRFMDDFLREFENNCQTVKHR